MDPLLIAALLIAVLSIVAAFFVLAIFLRNKRRQRELLADETAPNNQTPSGEHVFHSNRTIIVLYIVMLAVGTATILYGSFM